MPKKKEAGKNLLTSLYINLFKKKCNLFDAVHYTGHMVLNWEFDFIQVNSIISGYNLGNLNCHF